MPHDPQTELAISKALADDDAERATTALLRGYGDELLSFLVGLAGDVTIAEDVFGDFCERTWRSLPRFEGRSSARTWAYTIARNAFRDYLRAKSSTGRRHVEVASAEVAKVRAEVATRTLTFLKTATRDRFAELRTRLPIEDQTLLLLRVDRDLPWDDIATIVSDGDQISPATLRKRFERIKKKLRELAQAEGLLAP